MASPLLITWRSQTLRVPLTPTLTLSSLHEHLATLTSAPPSRQKLFFPRSHPRPASPDTPLLAHFGAAPARPLLLLASPHPHEPPADLPLVADDLSTPPRSPTPSPTPSPPSSPRAPRAPHPPSIARLDALLAGALLGPPFAARHPSLTLPPRPADPDPDARLSLTAAVSRSRRALRMLAVVLFDFARHPVASRALLRALRPTTPAHAAFEAAFHALPLDLAPVQTPSRLLDALGLHAPPAIVVLADVGTGVAVVDMFNTEWFGDLAAGDAPAHALADRLQQVVRDFDPFYHAARARRAAGEGRDAVVRDQDHALQASLRADRQREAAEAAAEAQRHALEAQADRERAEQEHARKEAVASLVREPERGGVRVVLRLPDGRRVQRAFDAERVVADVANWVVAEGGRKDAFRLVASFPRRVFEGAEQVSLQEAGFVPSVTLNVEEV